MPLDVSRSAVHQLLYLEGERFIGERFLVKQLLAPSMRLVDVGANIGYFLLLFEHAVGSDGRILCIEPEPDNLVDLRRVVEVNQLDNVQILPMALGTHRGTVSLARGLNGVVVADGNGVNVPVISLDEVWRQGSLDRIDFLKIDVEGYEGEVLAGAQEVITTQRPRIFLELHPTMLQGGHTISSIVTTLEEMYGEDVRFYEVPSCGPWDRFRAQYLGSDIVRTLSRREIVSSCETGQRTGTFWAVCT